VNEIGKLLALLRGKAASQKLTLFQSLKLEEGTSGLSLITFSHVIWFLYEQIEKLRAPEPQNHRVLARRFTSSEGMIS
jgi:hypothetical protein